MEEDIELLIDRVKERPALYDVKSSNYLNPRIRQKAWEDIGEELQISAEAAKEKWNKLRRCFCNALNRRRAKPTKKIPPWRYEEKMTFILPFVENRWTLDSTSTNVDPRVSPIYISAYSIKGSDEEEKEKYVDNTEIVFDAGVSTVTKEDEFKVDLPPKRKPNCTKLRKRKILHSKVAHNLKVNAQYQKKLIQPPGTLFSDFDETDMFFLSMSKMTKNLPKVDQSKIKLILSNAVLEADLQFQERECSSFTEQPSYTYSDKNVSPSPNESPSFESEVDWRTKIKEPQSE